MAVQVESFCKPFASENDPDATYYFHLEKDEVETEAYSISTVPTHDIWKKFELLPTPPRSPSRSPRNSPIDFADTLQSVSDNLDNCSAAPLTTVDSSLSSLKSKLIQDCMWNASNYNKSATESMKVHAAPNTELLYETPCSTPPPVEYVSSDCVDPSTVFPYPVNETHQNLCVSHSSSDSEEEIDVVSIEKPKTRKRAPPQVTDEPPAKRLKPVAVRPKASMSTTSPTKEYKKDLKRQTSATSDEDGEINKRATHNVLERKRRNDLKTSFHVLREEVPELKDNERAAKVTILRKAKECVDKLKNEESRFLEEFTKEQRRNEELVDRLHTLRQLKRK